MKPKHASAKDDLRAAAADATAPTTERQERQELLKEMRKAANGGMHPVMKAALGLI